MSMIDTKTVGKELTYRQGYRNAIELAMREYQLSILVPEYLGWNTGHRGADCEILGVGADPSSANENHQQR